jgi:hypothetical protein
MVKERKLEKNAGCRLLNHKGTEDISEEFKVHPDLKIKVIPVL